MIPVCPLARGMSRNEVVPTWSDDHARYTEGFVLGVLAPVQGGVKRYIHTKFKNVTVKSVEFQIHAFAFTGRPKSDMTVDFAHGSVDATVHIRVHIGPLIYKLHTPLGYVFWTKHNGLNWSEVAIGRNFAMTIERIISEQSHVHATARA